MSCFRLPTTHGVPFVETLMGVWNGYSKLAKEQPAAAALRLATFCLGFSVGSGGLDGDGGIPDLDWLMGEHRSLITHSIVPGIVVEIAIFALADFVATGHRNLPAEHDSLWDSIKKGSGELQSLALGVSAGRSYHLGVDASVDAGGRYQDLPVSLPQEGAALRAVIPYAAQYGTQPRGHSDSAPVQRR